MAEAARILDVAAGTVKSRCSRGRARLAAHLADLLVDDDTTPGDPHHPSTGNPGGPARVRPDDPRGPPASPSRP